jgi:hypothetical protein
MVPSPDLLSRLAPYPEWEDDQVALGYEAATGRVWIEPPPEKMLTSLSITSEAGVFDGAPPEQLDGPFDLFGPHRSSPCRWYVACGADLSILFKVTFGGSFGSRDVGNVAEPELARDYLLNDWYVAGSLAGGGALGDVNLVYVEDLAPGDANQDLAFDQLDLVQVLQANKYLTGQPATWGEGDWDAAPGGHPGNPPKGDGLFDQLDIIAALQSGSYLAPPVDPGPPLQAGDANQDHVVNQLDFVQLQIAGKYLTGQPATGGEGDFNGAPGGCAGNPPRGDGLFNHLDIIAAIGEHGCGGYCQGPYAAEGGAAAPVAVPEPAGIAMLAIGLWVLAGRRSHGLAAHRRQVWYGAQGPTPE